MEGYSATTGAQYPPKKALRRVVVMCSVGECLQQGNTCVAQEAHRYFVCMKRKMCDLVGSFLLRLQIGITSSQSGKLCRFKRRNCSIPRPGLLALSLAIRYTKDPLNRQRESLEPIVVLKEQVRGLHEPSGNRDPSLPQRH